MSCIQECCDCSLADVLHGGLHMKEMNGQNVIDIDLVGIGGARLQSHAQSISMLIEPPTSTSFL